MRRAVFIALGLASIVACQDEAQEPLALLRRPSGLAYAARTSSTGAAPRRADLFVADSEAQGVRVIQLIQFVNEEGFRDDFHYLLPSPSIFFPLLIPADGFPTALALSRDSQRLYALSPVKRALHALDVREVPYAGGLDSPGNVPLGTILFDDLGISGVPVTVATLGVNGGRDYLIVAFDQGPSAPGTLVPLVISHDGGAITAEARGSIDVGEEPRDIVVRGGSVLASSSKRLIHVATATATLEGPIFTGSQVVDAGSATFDLIDVPNQGVLALYSDRASVVLLEDDGTGIWRRSTRSNLSPFTSEDERFSPTSLGRFDLRPVPLTGGAYGRMVSPIFEVPNEEAFTLYQGDQDFVMINHLDGQSSILYGSPLRIAFKTLTRANEIIDKHSIDLVIEGGACQRQPLECGDATEVPECRAEVLGFASTLPRTIRASYRGDLAYSRSGTLVARGGGVFDVTDPAVDFVEREVKTGDQILLQLDGSFGCAATSTIGPLVATATTTTVAGDRVTLAFAADAIPPAFDCEAGVERALQKYQIYPGADEFVVSLVFGSLVLDVYHRIPVINDADEDRVELAGILNMTLSSDLRFQCETGFEAEGAECLIDAECGSAMCKLDADACSGRCPVSCPDATSPCVRRETVRRCTTLEVETTATEALVLDAAAGGGALPVPDHTVFSPMRRGFFTSFPGARDIVEIYQTVDGRFGTPRHLR